MDASQLAAGAGATTTLGVIAFFVYKLMTSTHCRSNCCGKTASLDFTSSTPPRRASVQTIQMPRTEAKVDAAAPV